jgi:hypothetical protein
MLKILIPGIERYDEENNMFINTQDTVIQVEHSLVSISKWESKWNKPFLSKHEKTIEETIDYVKCMTLTQNVKNEIYENLTNDNIDTISKYIAAPMTATSFNDNSQGKSNKIITSEIIYYWMISYNIPFECQKWHLNRLLTLIRVCDTNNQPKKKMSKAEIMNRNKNLNAIRKQQLNTKG